MPGKKSLSEAEICDRYITPALKKAGWNQNTQIRREYSFTAGRVIVRGAVATRGKKKRADYLLNYRSHLPPRIHPVILALVERDELKDSTYKGGLRSDKLDHLMIEVAYSHAKDDEFKLQMQKERRYVLEVNAVRFCGNGQHLTPTEFGKNSTWVWPNDKQENEQTTLFD